MTGSYGLPLTCLHCGGAVAGVAESRVFAGSECSAICRCTTCGRQWQVLVQLRPVLSARAQHASEMALVSA